MWTDFFDEIVCINILSRTDRLFEVTEELCKYSIPFQRVSGIEKENGADGLKETLELILKDAVDRKLSSILIFEDDVLFKTDPNPVMEQAVKELPHDWHILFLGGQAAAGFHYRHSSSLFQLDTCYATHAFAISNQGMKEVLSHGLYAPIDNCMVDTIQKLQKCYITYPLLATQRAGFSSIGQAWIDWDIFISKKYNDAISMGNK